MRQTPTWFDAIERYPDHIGRDTDEVGFVDAWRQHSPNLDLRYLKYRVQALRDTGETERRPPWPVQDRMPGDPGHVETGRGSAHPWGWYSPESLLDRTRVVMAGALDGYRRFAEEVFPRLAPHMLIAATLPACLCGTLVVRHTPDQPDVSPYVYWYLDPLPYGSTNEVRSGASEPRGHAGRRGQDAP